MREWIHFTQVRSHLKADENSLRWDDFSLFKEFPGLSQLDKIVIKFSLGVVLLLFRGKTKCML